jgi:hypothetical protein
MKSRRSWLIGLALGAALFFGTPSAKAQTVPRGITYQGLLLQNGAPFSGSVSMNFVITDLANNTLFQQASTGVVVTDGVFNVVLGDPSIFPAGIPNTVLFDRQYQLTITVNNGTPLPAQFLWSAPYALNSQRVGGLDVSPVPVNGDIFPMPLNTAGQIDPKMLPPIPDATLVNPPITSINTTVLPDANGNVNIVGGTGINVVNGPGGLVTINSTASGGGAITGVFGINGLQGGGPGPGNLYLSIAPGGITHGMLANGAVTGQDITGIAGAGLSQDAAGLLDVQVDNSTIGIEPINSLTNPNELYVLPAGIGTVQLANGSVTNAKIATPYINFTSGGGVTGANTLLPLSVQTQLGGTQNYDLNLGHTNTWTILQNFTNLTDVGTLTNTGAFAQTGVSTLLGATAINVTGGAATQIGTTNPSATSIGVLGGTNTIAGTTTINASVNNPTSINTGNSNANVAIGNNTVGQTNSVTIGSGTLGTIGITGTANINTTNLGAGLNPTNIGNSSNPVSVTATTYTGTIGTTYSLTAGTSTSISSPTNTMTATSSNALNGPTNINVSLNNPTNINTGTSTGAVSIGNTSNANTILGTTTINQAVGNNTSINTVSGAGTVAIGNASSTTNMLGAVNINTTGATNTIIGSGTSTLTVNGPTTHNGTTLFNNNITQNGGFSAQFDNTQINGNLTATGTLSSNTAGDVFTGNSTTPVLTLTNATSTSNALNVTSGIAQFGASGSADGQRVVINGFPTLTGPVANYELIDNGDALISGTLTAGVFSATTVNATTVNATTVNTTTLNATGAVTGNSGNFVTLNVSGASTQNTITTSGAITDNSNNLTLGAGSGAYQGTQVVSQGAIPGGTTPPASYVWTWPDKSGTVAMLSDIANISPPTADNQTLYSTGAGTLASPYVWTPTSNVQNNGTSQFLITSSTTLQANGPINFGAGNFTANSATISLSGGLMSSTDVTTIGTLNTDQTWLTVQGFVTAWTSTPYTGAPGATNPPTLPATVPFPLNDFESIVKGDEEVTGTLYTASEYSSLNASSLLRFDHAEPFTLSSVGPNTMEFSGAGTLAGTPVTTIDAIPTGSWGEQVTGNGNAAGGIQVTGFSAGTGILVDPTAVGINDEATQYGIVVGEQNPAPAPSISGLVVNAPNTGVAVIANTTGESINLSGAPVGTQVGLAIGATNPFITGETILAGTTGLTIGTAPTSINATGTINSSGTTGDGSLFTGSAPGTYTLTVNNTGNGNNGTGFGLAIGGTLTSTGNSTIGTNSGTTNTFGNSSNTTNNIGNGGGTTANTIGAGAASNVIGQNAGTNSVGFNLAGGGTVINNIGADNTGSTVTNTIGGSNGAISSGSVTNYIYGATNINTGGTALTTVGNTGTDQIWELINGINTAGVAAPPAIPGISPSQYELTDNGDAYIRGSVDAGQVTTGLLSAPNIAFNFATAYTPGNSMVFNGSGNTNPVVSIGTVAGTPVGNGQYGLQVTTNNAAAAGGINITGSGAPVGMNVSGAVTGESITATTTGETIDGGSNGIKIGFNSAPTTAININSGSTTGMLITSPTGTGISLASMGGVTGVNYSGTTGTGFSASGTTGTGFLAVESGAGMGVQARVNNAGAYAGVNTAIAGLNASNAGIVGLSGSLTSNTNAEANTAGVYGETNQNNSAGVVGVNSSAVNSAAGVYGSATNAPNFAIGVIGIDNTNGGQNYGLLGTTNNSLGTDGTIAAAANMGYSTVAATPAVGAVSNVSGGTAVKAIAEGGGNSTGMSVALSSAGNPGFAGSTPNSTGIAVNVAVGATTGIYIKGSGATSSYVPSTGTGIYVDPATEGIVAVATTTGAEFMPQTTGTGTGLNLGNSGIPLLWATGENIFATGTGLNITAPTSISANGLITTSGNITTTGSGSITSNTSVTAIGQGSAMGNVANTATALTVSNTNNPAIPALQVNGSETVTGTVTGGAFVGGSGSFTTLTSTLATTLNTSGGNVTNTFGNNIAAGTTTINQIGMAMTSGTSQTNNNIGSSTVAGETATNTIGAAVTGSTANTTVGSLTGSVTNTLDGLTVANPPTSGTNGTNTVTIVASPDASTTWALKASSALTDANASQGIFGTATSSNAVGNAANAGRFDATGNGTTNTALSINTSGVSTVANIGSNTSVTGASTGPGSTGGNRGAVVAVSGSTVQNIGEDITVSGTASTGIRLNAGPNTGISFDASSAATTLGEQITGIRNTGLLLNFTSGQNGVNGESVDMTNATGGAYNGISVSNLNASSDDAITIGYTTGGNGGTGLAINMPGNGNGSGISLTSVGSGSGIQVLGVSGNGYGVSVTGASNSGNIISTVNATGGKGIVAYADGTSGTTALQVGSSGGNGGNVVSDGSGVGTLASPSNRWVDTYTLQATDLNGANNTLTIYNNLVTTTSTILITVQGPQTGTEGYVTISGLSSGHFTVNTTASNWGTVGTPNVNAIHYMVVNH